MYWHKKWKFLGQGLRKSEPEHRTYTDRRDKQTHATERISTPHSRVLTQGSSHVQQQDDRISEILGAALRSDRDLLLAVIDLTVPYCSKSR